MAGVQIFLSCQTCRHFCRIERGRRHPKTHKSNKLSATAKVKSINKYPINHYIETGSLISIKKNVKGIFQDNQDLGEDLIFTAGFAIFLSLKFSFSYSAKL